MSDILLDVQSAPTTPSAGQAVMSVDTTTKRLRVTDDAGFRRTLGVVNFSTAAQTPAAATRVYIIGSNVVFPVGALQVGTLMRWTFNMTKTAFGSATSTFDIALGTLGTTADTARVSFTKPAGTAAIDEAQVVISMVCRGPVGASGVCVGVFAMQHNLAATGHATIPSVNVVTVSSAFDITTPTNVGVCITSGAADAITIQSVIAEAWNF